MCVQAYLFNFKNIHSSQTGQTHNFFFFPQNYKECFHQYSYNFYLFFYHLLSENFLTVKINK